MKTTNFNMKKGKKLAVFAIIWQFGVPEVKPIELRDRAPNVEIDWRRV
jgi:hypothetical protein